MCKALDCVLYMKLPNLVFKQSSKLDNLVPHSTDQKLKFSDIKYLV